MKNWKKSDVHREVPYNGLKHILVKFIFTEKLVDKRKTVKSRVLVRELGET